MCDSKDDAQLNDPDHTFVIRENTRLKHRCPFIWNDHPYKLLYIRTVHHTCAKVGSLLIMVVLHIMVYRNLVQSLILFSKHGRVHHLFTRMYRAALVAQEDLQLNFAKAFEMCFTNKKSLKFWWEIIRKQWIINILKTVNNDKRHEQIMIMM